MDFRIRNIFLRFFWRIRVNEGPFRAHQPARCEVKNKRLGYRLSSLRARIAQRSRSGNNVRPMASLAEILD